MDESLRKPDRTLQLRFEGSRLEEQFWSMAYEEIWPVIRRSLKRSVEQRTGVVRQGSRAADAGYDRVHRCVHRKTQMAAEPKRRKDTASSGRM